MASEELPISGTTGIGDRPEERVEHVEIALLEREGDANGLERCGAAKVRVDTGEGTSVELDVSGSSSGYESGKEDDEKGEAHGWC